MMKTLTVHSPGGLCVAVVAVLTLVGCGSERDYSALQVQRALNSVRLHTHVAFGADPTVKRFFNGRAGMTAGPQNLFAGTHLRSLVVGPQRGDATHSTVSAMVFDSREAAEREIGPDAQVGNDGIAVVSIRHSKLQQHANVVVASSDPYAPAVHKALLSLP